jgi:hypothetical protein
MDKSYLILVKVQRHPEGIGLMDCIRPFLSEYSETGLRYTIRDLELKGKIRAVQLLGRWLLFPIQDTVKECDGVFAVNTRSTALSGTTYEEVPE